jgi:hypothetical protein
MFRSDPNFQFKLDALQQDDQRSHSLLTIDYVVNTILARADGLRLWCFVTYERGHEVMLILFLGCKLSNVREEVLALSISPTVEPLIMRNSKNSICK